jgi:hypothetical protein
MNDVQNNQERMGAVTLDTLKLGASIYVGNPVFKGHVETHDSNLITVRAWRDKQEESRSIPGITRDKNVLRSLNTITAMAIVSACKSLASDTKNNELLKSVNFSTSSLNKMREGSYVAACRLIQSTAAAKATSLLAYGITPAMLTDLTNDTTAFENMSSKTRTKRSSIVVYTANLQKSIKTMLNHLKQNLDFSIKQFLPAHPDFVEAYFVSRRIVNYGNTHTGLRGTIRNEQTGMKIKNALVEIVELNKITSTNNKGVYYFGQLPMGKYTIRLRAEGYITTEFPEVQLHDGKLRDLDLTIAAVPASMPVHVHA